MQIQLPFDTAVVLSKTTFRIDEPEVWSRYQNNTVIRYGLQTGARVFTQIGLHDMEVVRSFICRWLEEQDSIPADQRSDATDELYKTAYASAAILADAIGRVTQEAPC